MVESFNPKIILVGMPDMLNICLKKLLDNNFNVIGIVPPHSAHPSYQNTVAAANFHNLEVYNFEKTPNEAEFIEKIASLEADIGVITSYDKKLSKDFLKTTKFGYINCHPSLLPHYRGSNPYYHAIKNGEEITGVTLHFADENFDTGEIIAQKPFRLSEKETMGTLFCRSNQLMANLLIDVLGRFRAEMHIPSVEQIQGDFVKAPQVEEAAFLDWELNVEQIERLIRASNPFYNCITGFRGQGMRVISAEHKIKKHDKKCGIITNIDKNKIEIAVKDGYIYPTVVQYGTYGIFAINEFAIIFNPQKGESFG